MDRKGITMSDRKRLPDTRASMTRKFTVGHFEFYVIVGFYENNQPGEVFINVAKQGSTFGGMMDSWAVTLSLLLQHGVPWFELHKKFEYMRFEPMDEGHLSPVAAIVKNVSQMVDAFGGCTLFGYDGKPPEPSIKELVKKKQQGFRDSLPTKESILSGLPEPDKLVPDGGPLPPPPEGPKQHG